MPAYMVIACKINDREKFVAGYGQEAAKLVDKYGGEYLFVAPGATLLEGTLEGYTSMAVSKWPSRKAAEDFWHSGDYAEVRKLREGLAEVEVFLIEVP